MRLLISFFLSLFIYLSLIGLFIYFMISNNKQNKIQKVFIHQAIVTKHKKQNISQIKKIPKIKPKQEIKKEIKKEKIEKPKVEPKLEVKTKPKTPQNSVKKTEDTIAKGGENIKFDDIFANTPDNIPTKKIIHKKTEEMTKKKGNTKKEIKKPETEKKEEFSKLVKQELSKLESNVAIVSNSNKKNSNYISNEFEKVWAKIDTKDGDFITLNINIINGTLNVVVIATNLDTILLNKFLNELKNINLSKIKNFNGKITFNTKLKGN